MVVRREPFKVNLFDMSSSLPTTWPELRNYARQMDQKDPLKGFRKQFRIPVSVDGTEEIYFLGNSLGLQPVRTASAIQEILEDWANWGVEGFFNGQRPWLQFHDRLAQPLARLVGALPQEVVVMNQLTVNLHLMLVSFYRPTPARYKILCERPAFSSDLYMLQTHIRHLGYSPEEVLHFVNPRDGEQHLHIADVVQAIEQNAQEIALVLLGGVNYYTGQRLDMRTITAAGHAAGAKVGFDLAHAVGNVPLQLHDWNVDFACWCSYKYLNAGPGAVAGAYIHERYHQADLPRLGGWWGHETASRFLMPPDFHPTPSAEGWQLSTPPLLLYAALQASLELFEEAGIGQLHQKQQTLTGFLWQVLEAVQKHTAARSFEIITPASPEQQGCQVSLHFIDRGKTVFDRLMAKNIRVDWREPEVIRLAPVPFYNCYDEICRFGESLQTILNELK